VTGFKSLCMGMMIAGYQPEKKGAKGPIKKRRFFTVLREAD